MEIKIYSTPPCPYCKMVKSYLSSKNISYQDSDVSSNLKAREEMVKVSGQMGVPVVVINGEVIIGFDKAKIDVLLNKKII